MMRKQVIFIADSLDNAHTYHQVLQALDVGVSAGSSIQFNRLLQEKIGCDLVIYEIREQGEGDIAQIEQTLEAHGNIPLLLIVKTVSLRDVHLPSNGHTDFILSGAPARECSLRISRLLWPHNETAVDQIITVDAMTINLATYQVHVAGNPVDFTYLEYALLAFLVTHPGRTFSRDALLRRVWGFDYYGGSRTVDVHVRRVRAKLGPDLAHHLETVRGVGYLWKQ